MSGRVDGSSNANWQYPQQCRADAPAGQVLTGQPGSILTGPPGKILNPGAAYVAPNQCSVNQTSTYEYSNLQPLLVQFGASEPQPVDAAALIADLRNRFVVDGRVPVSKAEELQNAIDGLFANPRARQALIERFSLHSPPNKEALVAVTVVESGSNGDMGEVMNTVMNRTLLKNMMSEMTGRRQRYPVTSTINESNQFTSKDAVNGILKGRDTPKHHLRDYGPAARQVLEGVLQGQTRFSRDVEGNFRDASDIYFFNQEGFGRRTTTNQFQIGVHHFGDRITGSTSYVSSVLQDFGKLNWNK